MSRLDTHPTTYRLNARVVVDEAIHYALIRILFGSILDRGNLLGSG